MRCPCHLAILVSHAKKATDSLCIITLSSRPLLPVEAFRFISSLCFIFSTHTHTHTHTQKILREMAFTDHQCRLPPVQTVFDLRHVFCVRHQENGNACPNEVGLSARETTYIQLQLLQENKLDTKSTRYYLRSVAQHLLYLDCSTHRDWISEIADWWMETMEMQ
jgi:hypothetical protein